MVLHIKRDIQPGRRISRLAEGRSSCRACSPGSSSMDRLQNQNLSRRIISMSNLRRWIPTIFIVSLVVLCLPMIAAAQGRYEDYGGNYGRNGDYRRDNDRYGYYDQRRLRDSVKRLDNLSRDFQKHLDSALDHSRYNNSQREDRINDVAHDFRNATGNLKDRYDDGKNLNRSSGEARRLLQLGSVLNAFMARNRLDYRVESDWSRIRQELSVVASAYGFNIADFDNRDYRYDDNRGNDTYRRRGNNRRVDWSW